MALPRGHMRHKEGGGKTGFVMRDRGRERERDYPQGSRFLDSLLWNGVVWCGGGVVAKVVFGFACWEEYRPCNPLAEGSCCVCFHTSTLIPKSYPALGTKHATSRRNWLCAVRLELGTSIGGGMCDALVVRTYVPSLWSCLLSRETSTC